MTKRTEVDFRGNLEIPNGMLYGAHTARAVENFSISGQGIGRDMIKALGYIKKAAATVNLHLGRLAPELADAIIQAADEVISGELDDHFPVDLFQTGSGTSSNMNANEVISNRAIQLLGGVVGSKSPVHPNDHVNMGQSSNDVFPTAIHVAALVDIETKLLPVLRSLRDALKKKSIEFSKIFKMGRTHFQDAVPMTLGQEFSGFTSQIDHGINHLALVAEGLWEIPIGGTAIGTGLNTHPEFGKRMASRLSEMTGATFMEAANHFEAQSARDAAVRVSGALRALATILMKIADDIRWLGSGPRAGLRELILPEVAVGSSIMPGKINPVIAESLIQASAQVLGNDAAIAVAGFYSNFQLNTMQPLIARNLLEQIRLIRNAVNIFTVKLVKGIEPNLKYLSAVVESPTAMATLLAPHIGYDKASEIAKESEKTGESVRSIVEAEKLLPSEKIAEIFAPIEEMIKG